jgi:hypothetical protein
MRKGALHVHSRYSDGEFTLEELRAVFLSQGCDFACVTDHAEWLDESSLHRYCEECGALSDDRFEFVAGLEYECEQRLHIVGYGCTRLVDSKAPQEVMTRIAAAGAVPVIAHPKDALFEWIESFEILPQGLEVWNSKYDGRYAPRPGTFALLERLRRRQPSIKAFYGQDLHWKHQYRGLFVELDAGCPGVLAALASGAFTAVKDGRRLPSAGEVSEAMLQEFARRHSRSDRLRQAIKAGKRLFDGAGVVVPASLKAQIRRVF